MKKQRSETGEYGKSERGNHTASSSSISLIFFLLDILSDKIYTAFTNSLFGKWITSYSLEQHFFENSLIKKNLLENSKLVIYVRKFLTYLSKSFESSFFIHRFQKIGNRFMTIPLKAFGNFFLSFGVYTIFVCFFKWIIWGWANSSLLYGLTGVFLCLIAFPMLRSRDSIAQAIVQGTLSSFIFVHMFGFRKESFEAKPSRSKLLSNVMIFLGLFCGLLTFVIDPFYIVSGLLFFLSLILLFSMPEIGVILTILLLPFLYLLSSPSIALGLLIAATLISYVIKLIRGKRILKFELLDFSILMFLLAMFFSGTITAGGMVGYNEVLISCVLLCGYFLIVNLMRTEIWVKRCVFSLIFSGTITAIFGIFQYLLKEFHSGAWLDLELFSNIEGRVDVFFGNPNILAVYLILVFPFSLGHCIQATSKKEKLLYLVSAGFIFVCTILTWSRGAWIAILAELLIFALMHSKKTLRYLILASLAVPFLPFLLPESISNRLFSIGNLADSSSMYRIYTWKGSWNLIKEYFWGGIGYGNTAFREIYPHFAYAGIEAAEHSHNLALQVLIGMGIGGLFLLSWVLILYFQKNMEHVKISKNGERRTMLIACMCAVFAALIMGMFDFIWFNYRIFFMFWVVIGLTCSYTSIGRDEMRRENFEQTIDERTAAIDLNLNM